VTVDENDGVFHHRAYEAYDDLLRDAMKLLAEENPLLHGGGRSRWLALDEQAHHRALEPTSIVAERDAVLAMLKRLGVDAPALPDTVPHRAWRWVLRQIERTNQIKKLGGPDFVIADGLSRLRETLTILRDPSELYEPDPCNWRSEAELVFDTMKMVLVNGDPIGIEGAANRLPEALAFRTTYPGAYSFWDIHSQPADLEDANKPDPERYPGAIWTAQGITLPCAFAPNYQPPPESGPITYGTSEGLVEWVKRDHSPVVADFVRACRSAAGRGRGVVSLIEIHT
jgi:hypothetical protein